MRILPGIIALGDFRFLIIRIDDSHAHSVAVQMVIAQMAAMRLLARDFVFA